ncbi:MAG: hypothetical protein CME70_20255 [Halobacteriovorax sp.]|nr:hypothetical protein [Halobacteriovorax sp.]
MQNTLERRLGLFSVVTICISSMLGSGIFVLPGLGFAITGPSIYLAYLLSALCILPAAMSKAELATAMPTSGGTYVYLERTFGPLAGTVSGLGLWLSILLKAAFALIGIGAYMSVISSLPLKPTILSFLAVIAFINVLGVGKVSRFMTVILFISIAGMTAVDVLGIFTWKLSNLKPLFPRGMIGLGEATALVFVSFAGVTKVAAIAEEVKDPGKNLSRGILLSLVIVTVLYCVTSLVMAGNFSYLELAGDLKPAYTLATKVGGPIFGSIIAVIAILTMVNVSNAGLLAGSRFPFAMSRDKLLPSFLGKLHKKFLTPISSIILSFLVVAFVLVSFDVTKIAKMASAFMIAIYMVENISVVVLRESRTQWYKPVYKAPLYPFLQVFGIISGLALLIGMGILALKSLAFISALGIILYFVYSRRKTDRKGVVGIRGKRTDLLQEQMAPGVTNSSYKSMDLSRDARLVVSLFGKERSPEMLIEMGVALAEHGNLEVAHILEIPEQASLHDIIEEPAELRSLRRRVIAMAIEKKEPITFDPVVSHDMSRTIFEISQRLHCQWLLIEWRGRNRGALTFHNPIGWLKSHLHCNLAVFRDSGVRYVRKIIALIATDKNDALVLETSDHLAEVNRADITLIRFAHDSVSEEKKRYEQSFLDELASTLKAPTHTKVLTGKDEIQAVISETVEFDLLVLGSTDHSIKKAFLGSKDDQLIAKAACSVLAVHSSSL